MTLSSSHYLAVNVPYVHLLPECRPQPDVSLPPKDNPKFLACCMLSENLPQFSFEEFPHHPLEINTPTILNGLTSRNAADLIQVSMEARHLVHLCPSTGQETSIQVSVSNKAEICGCTTSICQPASLSVCSILNQHWKHRKPHANMALSVFTYAFLQRAVNVNEWMNVCNSLF
jgi:hypothetical protein